MTGVLLTIAQLPVEAQQPSASTRGRERARRRTESAIWCTAGGIARCPRTRDATIARRYPSNRVNSALEWRPAFSRLRRECGAEATRSTVLRGPARRTGRTQGRWRPPRAPESSRSRTFPSFPTIIVGPRVLAIRLAIYWARLHRIGPHQTDSRTDVTCDNVTTPHQTDVCRATTDQKVGGSSPSERAELSGGHGLVGPLSHVGMRVSLRWWSVAAGRPEVASPPMRAGPGLRSVRASLVQGPHNPPAPPGEEPFTSLAAM